MAGEDVELYFDLGSPYAHLAVARAERVLGRPPVLRPVLLGAIFAARGFGSWSQSAQREGRIAELETRAARYGLPPFAWPPGWPLDGLAAMRACVWAEERGGLDRFAHAAFEREFGRGEDISASPALAAIAAEVGLPGDELEQALASAPVKARLRADRGGLGARRPRHPDDRRRRDAGLRRRPARAGTADPRRLSLS